MKRKSPHARKNKLSGLFRNKSKEKEDLDLLMNTSALVLQVDDDSDNESIDSYKEPPTEPTHGDVSASIATSKTPKDLSSLFHKQPPITMLETCSAVEVKRVVQQSGEIKVVTEKVMDDSDDDDKSQHVSSPHDDTTSHSPTMMAAGDDDDDDKEPHDSPTRSPRMLSPFRISRRYSAVNSHTPIHSLPFGDHSPESKNNKNNNDNPPTSPSGVLRMPSLDSKDAHEGDDNDDDGTNNNIDDSEHAIAAHEEEDKNDDNRNSTLETPCNLIKGRDDEDFSQTTPVVTPVMFDPVLNSQHEEKARAGRAGGDDNDGNDDDDDDSCNSYSSIGVETDSQQRASSPHKQAMAVQLIFTTNHEGSPVGIVTEGTNTTTNNLSSSNIVRDDGDKNHDTTVDTTTLSVSRDSSLPSDDMTSPPLWPSSNAQGEEASTCCFGDFENQDCFPTNQNDSSADEHGSQQQENRLVGFLNDEDDEAEYVSSSDPEDDNSTVVTKSSENNNNDDAESEYDENDESDDEDQDNIRSSNGEGEIVDPCADVATTDGDDKLHHNEPGKEDRKKEKKKLNKKRPKKESSKSKQKNDSHESKRSSSKHSSKTKKEDLKKSEKSSTKHSKSKKSSDCTKESTRSKSRKTINEKVDNALQGGAKERHCDVDDSHDNSNRGNDEQGDLDAPSLAVPNVDHHYITFPDDSNGKDCDFRNDDFVCEDFVSVLGKRLEELDQPSRRLEELDEPTGVDEHDGDDDNDVELDSLDAPLSIPVDDISLQELPAGVTDFVAVPFFESSSHFLGLEDLFDDDDEGEGNLNTDTDDRNNKASTGADSDAAHPVNTSQTGFQDLNEPSGGDGEDNLDCTECATDSAFDFESNDALALPSIDSGKANNAGFRDLNDPSEGLDDDANLSNDDLTHSRKSPTRFESDTPPVECNGSDCLTPGTASLKNASLDNALSGGRLNVGDDALNATTSAADGSGLDESVCDIAGAQLLEPPTSPSSPVTEQDQAATTKPSFATLWVQSVEGAGHHLELNIQELRESPPPRSGQRVASTGGRGMPKRTRSGGLAGFRKRMSRKLSTTS